MSDNTGTPEAPNAAEIPAVTPEVKPDAETTEKPLTADDAAFWRKEAKEKASAEAALRKRLKDFERDAEARKQSEMSEAEKLQAELQRVKGENSELLTFKQSTAIRDAVTDAARDPQLGARRPEALHKLVDHGALEFDDDGKLIEKSLSREIARIKDDFPELFFASGGSANGGDGARNAVGQAGQSFDMNALIRRQTGRI